MMFETYEQPIANTDSGAWYKAMKRGRKGCFYQEGCTEESRNVAIYSAWLPRGVRLGLEKIARQSAQSN
jgi:hypothetical protein